MEPPPPKFGPTYLVPKVWSPPPQVCPPSQVWSPKLKFGPPNVVPKCRPQVWSPSVVHQCGPPEWSPSVVHKCGPQVWSTSVVPKCPKLAKWSSPIPPPTSPSMYPCITSDIRSFRAKRTLPSLKRFVHACSMLIASVVHNRHVLRRLRSSRQIVLVKCFKLTLQKDI